MFKKILIIEDLDSIALGITAMLEKHILADIRTTKYCDEAYLKVRKAIYEDAPFDLIITDLSFKADHREAKLTGGEQLIKALRKEQPKVKIIVYSVEERPYKIKSLFENDAINAYVVKGRESNNELLEAIAAIHDDYSKYMSPQISHFSKYNILLEIDDHDIDLIRELSKGLTQEEISIQFKKEGKMASGISSIEKRLNKLKIFFKANNAIHLVAIAKDLGLI